MSSSLRERPASVLTGIDSGHHGPTSMAIEDCDWHFDVRAKTCASDECSFLLQTLAAWRESKCLPFAETPDRGMAHGSAIECYHKCRQTLGMIYSTLHRSRARKQCLRPQIHTYAHPSSEVASPPIRLQNVRTFQPFRRFHQAWVPLVDGIARS